MTKKHQNAFNKAYLNVLQSRERALVPNKNKRSYDVVVPTSVIIREFKKFIKVVEKDLKIGKHKPNKPAAAKKTGRSNVSKNR